MYRQFVKMSRVKAINNGLKVAKGYIGGDLEHIVKTVSEDDILTEGTRDALTRLLYGNTELEKYSIREFLIDKFYITSVVEAYDVRAEFAIIKVLMDLVGIILFRADKRIYKSYNGEYVSSPMIYDLVNVKYRPMFDAKEYEFICESRLRNLTGGDKSVKLNPEDFAKLNDKIDLLYADVENLKYMARGINEEFNLDLPIVKESLVKFVTLTDLPMNVKDIDFTGRASINPLLTGIEVFNKKVYFKEIVLDDRLHLIVARCNDDVLIIPTKAVGNILIKDPIFIGSLLQYYKLRDVGVKYNVIHIEGQECEEGATLQDNKKVIRVVREKVCPEVHDLANKWNIKLDSNESLYRKQMLK